MNNEFQVSGFNQTFRIKKMNAIELFALRTQIDLKDFNSALSTVNLILEKVEVQVDDATWLPVKEGSNFFPADIENDVNAIDEICSKFMKEVRQVFLKSNASNA